MDFIKLIDDVKIKLTITWEDIDTQTKIQNMVDDAIHTLNYKLGAEIDYSINGIEHNLFLNYCLYAWNDCSDEFDTKYLNEIYQIRIKYEVERYEETEI